MFTFLATIFIFYLVWLLVKPLILAYARRKYTERINDMFGQAFGGPPPGPQSAGDRSGRQQSRNPFENFYPRRKKKIFSRDEGEYIDFVEIDEKVEYTTSEPPRKPYHPREPQVSDVEWEDVK